MPELLLLLVSFVTVYFSTATTEVSQKPVLQSTWFSVTQWTRYKAYLMNVQT